MKKIYHLATCNTCQKIIKELNNGEDFELQNIKVENISKEQLAALKDKVGSFEALFNRRSMKYRSMGLKDKQLSEEDYEQLILDEYTFLKRPVIIINNQVFVGNSKKTIVAAKNALEAA